MFRSSCLLHKVTLTCKHPAKTIFRAILGPDFSALSRLGMSVRLLRTIDPFTKIWHAALGSETGGGMLSDNPRDFTLLSRVKMNPDKSYDIVALSFSDPAYPLTAGYVRGKIHCLGWHIRPGQNDHSFCTVTLVCSIDLNNHIHTATRSSSPHPTL